MAARPGLSRPPASFIASGRQGVHRAPFTAWPPPPRPPVTSVIGRPTAGSRPSAPAACTHAGRRVPLFFPSHTLASTYAFASVLFSIGPCRHRSRRGSRLLPHSRPSAPGLSAGNGEPEIGDSDASAGLCPSLLSACRLLFRPQSGCQGAECRAGPLGPANRPLRPFFLIVGRRVAPASFPASLSGRVSVGGQSSFLAGRASRSSRPGNFVFPRRPSFSFPRPAIDIVRLPRPPVKPGLPRFFSPRPASPHRRPLPATDRAEVRKGPEGESNRRSVFLRGEFAYGQGQFLGLCRPRVGEQLQPGRAAGGTTVGT